MNRFLTSIIFSMVAFFSITLNVSAQTFKCGDKIVLTHVSTGAHLHSHPINYTHPGSSGQQQITAYQGSDANDVWILQDCPNNQIKDGYQFRLQHQSTGMYLHSHANIPAPITQSQQEVTGWTGKDNNDLWRIEIEGGGNWTVGKRFRLIHIATNMALHSHNITGGTIPTQQQEVTGYSGRDENDFWRADIATFSSINNGQNGNGSNSSYFRERVFRSDLQHSELRTRINFSDNGKIDYSFSLRNKDQYVGSCAVFYIIIADNRGNIIKTLGGDQYCVDGAINNRDRANREDKLSSSINRNDLSNLGSIQVIATQGGKISPDVLRGNVQVLTDIINSCPDCIKILPESTNGNQRNRN